jgi:hypothetical protein
MAQKLYLVVPIGLYLMRGHYLSLRSGGGPISQEIGLLMVQGALIHDFTLR